MKFALLLSGCGQHDGSETHEVILTLLGLAKEEVVWDAFAPNISQSQVVNHLSEKISQNETRNVLVESARLVRGKIKDLVEADLNQYDALILPGGFGAVSNLCNWGEKGFNFEFNSDVQKFLEKAVLLKKPVGFICISPVIIPRLYTNCKLTIGNDPILADQINKVGGKHVNCPADGAVVDHENKVVSTPANMVTNNIVELQIGIQKLIQELKKMCRSLQHNDNFVQSQD